MSDEFEDFAKKPYKVKKPIILIFVLLFIIAVVGFIWAYSKYREVSQQIPDISTTGEQLSEEEIEKILSDVKKHIFIPETEVPTIATVTDAESLAQQQPFFLYASDGDKILIFKERAIIYSPEKDIVINVGPVFVDQVEPMSVDIRNGSNIEGIEVSFGQELNQRYGFEIVNTANASKEYEESVLVNLSGKDIAPLERALGIKSVTELPPGEQPSNAEIVFIIGSANIVPAPPEQEQTPQQVTLPPDTSITEQPALPEEAIIPENGGIPDMGETPNGIIPPVN